jgi:hypothetical protein
VSDWSSDLKRDCDNSHIHRNLTGPSRILSSAVGGFKRQTRFDMA